MALPPSLLRRILGPSLVAGLAIALIACESKSSTSTGPSPIKCLVSLTPPPDSLEPGGGKAAVTVSAQPECSWTASSDATWITGLTPASGQGNGQIEFQATANPAGTMRQGHIAVNDQQIPVQQRPSPCRFEVSPAALSIDADGGTVAITVTTLAGCGWQVSVDAGWVVIGSSSGTGSGSVTLRVASNGGETRNATIVVAGQTVALTQTSTTSPTPGGPAGPGGPGGPGGPSNCVFSLDRASEAVPAAGGSVTVAVSGAPGCARTATSQAPWISIVAGGSGTASGAVTFNVAANNGAGRTGTLSIAGHGFTVFQSSSGGPNCSYSIAPAQQSIGAAGGAGASISISTSNGCAWTAASQASWISVSSSAGGSGDGTVSFTVAANSGGARTGTLAIAGQTATVNQAAAAASSCSYSISPGNQSIGASGGGGSVAVSTAAGCAWNARSNDGWISLTSGANGNGAGSVAFNVAANSSSARSGTLTIAGETFTVSQASGSCSYSISPTEQAIDEKGASLSVAVSAGAGCGWTATSHESWISITDGASGSGNGTVRFTVESTGGKQRIGTLTIAGRTFTVDQHKKNDE